jgi:colicin import membrane protein
MSETALRKVGRSSASTKISKASGAADSSPAAARASSSSSSSKRANTSSASSWGAAAAEGLRASSISTSPLDWAGDATAGVGALETVAATAWPEDARGAEEDATASSSRSDGMGHTGAAPAASFKGAAVRDAASARSRAASRAAAASCAARGAAVPASADAARKSTSVSADRCGAIMARSCLVFGSASNVRRHASRCFRRAFSMSAGSFL